MDYVKILFHMNPNFTWEKDGIDFAHRTVKKSKRAAASLTSLLVSLMPDKQWWDAFNWLTGSVGMATGDVLVTVGDL
jgi:hypothetical protein